MKACVCTKSEKDNNQDNDEKDLTQPSCKDDSGSDSEECMAGDEK